MAASRAPIAVDCTLCGMTISRKADLPRHMKTHATNKEDLMYTCPYVGCRYRALQRSNLITHLNVHSRERPNKCPAEGCEFSTSDPGSLTRHRKERHGYEPRGTSSGNHVSANSRKAARQRRRHTPYTPSSSSGSTHSVSPDPSSPSSSILLTDDHVEEGSKNASAADSTELITKCAQVNDSHFAPNARPENNPPLDSGLSTASEAPAAEHPQLPVPEQGNLYAADAAAQIVSEVIASDEEFDDFFAQFNDWQPAASSLPTPILSYNIENVPVPTTLPPYAIDDAYITTPAFLHPYAVDHTLTSTPAFLPPYAVDGAPIPPSASQPPYEVQSIVDNASYEYYGYTTEAVSFDAQLSQPDSFATPDMGVYPRDVNQGYLYNAYAGTSSFAMHGLYVN